MSTNTTGHFRIRTASSAHDDVSFILAAWDSVLPFLSSIGSDEMWGSQPFSQRDGVEQDIIEDIQRSEANPHSDSGILIAEHHTPMNDVVKVGAAMIRDKLPWYLTERPELRCEVEKGKELLFVEVVISDFRVEPLRRRGTGAALIEAIKQRAMASGKEAIYLDAWAGNGRKLNTYYERLGFRKVSDFSLQRKNGSVWLGTFYCIDLASSNVPRRGAE